MIPIKVVIFITFLCVYTPLLVFGLKKLGKQHANLEGKAREKIEVRVLAASILLGRWEKIPAKEKLESCEFLQ